MIPAAALALLLAAPDLHVRPPEPQLRLHVSPVVTERNTQTALIATAVALLLVEWVIVHNRQEGNITPTISQVMTEWGTRYGTVDWLAGGMMGHWFWPDERPASPAEVRRGRMTALWLTAGVFLWDVVDHSGRDKARGPVLFAVGFFAGHMLVPAR